MRPSYQLSRSAVAAAMCALAFSAQAQSVIGSASASLDQLRYTLIDLAPDDGIAAGLAINGQWVATQGLYPPGSMSAYDVQYTEFVNAPGNLFGAGSVVTQSSPDGMASLTFGPNGASLTSTLSSNSMLTGPEPYSYSYQYPSVDADGHPVLVTETRTMTNVDVRGISAAEAGLGVIDAPSSNFGSPIYPNAAAQLTLTPHTLLLINAGASMTLQADRSDMLNTVATAGGEGGTYIDSYLIGNGMLNAQVLIGLAGFDNYVPGFQQTFSGYGQTGSVADLGGTMQYGIDGFQDVEWLDEGTNQISVVVDELSRTRTFSQNIQVQYANASDDSISLEFVLGLKASAEQSIRGSIDSTSITTEPYDPGVEVPPVLAVPEPASYALMGLGLVGLSLVRRRHQAAA